jgi:hypothetical protein
MRGAVSILPVGTGIAFADFAQRGVLGNDAVIP